MMLPCPVPTHSIPLSESVILLFAILLCLVCWTFIILICRDLSNPRPLSKRRQ